MHKILNAANSVRRILAREEKEGASRCTRTSAGPGRFQALNQRHMKMPNEKRTRAIRTHSRQHARRR